MKVSFIYVAVFVNIYHHISGFAQYPAALKGVGLNHVIPIAQYPETPD